MIKRFFFLSLSAALMLVLAASVHAQGETPALDLVIALDVSGSMSVDASRTTFDAVDRGWRKLREVNGDSFAATDPAALRFGITDMLLEWLAAYPEVVDINASVVTFADSASVALPWTALRRRGGDERLLSPLDTGAARSEEQQNSNFMALYTLLRDLFSDRPAGSRRAVLLITDSVPCFPTGLRDANAPLYDQYCEEIPSMVRHVNALAGLGSASEYVLFVSSVSAIRRWEPFPGVREAWLQRIGSGGAFIDLDSMAEVPAAVMNVVLREIALARGLIAPEDAPADGRLPQAVYGQLGITYTPNGRLNVGPYQTQMVVLAALPDADAEIAFTPDPGTAVETLYGSENEALRIIRLTRPQVGTWAVEAKGGTVPVWALFSPARARLTLQPAQPTRFVPQQLVYELVDENGEPFEVNEATTPQFNITVVPPGGTAINLNAMEPTADNRAWISPPFLPTAAGSYRLEVSVLPGEGQWWRLSASSDFLTPASLPPIQAAGMTFVAEYDVLEPENSPPVGDVTTTAVRLPRSVALGVRVTARLDTDQATPLPQGMSAEVRLTSPGSATCPQPITQPMNIDPNSRDAAFIELRFAEAGVCRAEVLLTITSLLQPLSGRSLPVSVETGERQLTITHTEYLSLRLTTADGQPPPPGESASSPLYHVIDRASTPLQWAFNTVHFRLEVVNEEGKPVEPQFAPGAQVPDRDHCEASDPKIVPVRLQILSSERDVAEERGICFYSTDAPGVYRASATGLTAGDYIVRASIERNQPPLNLAQQEYAPTLFDGSSDSAQVSAHLKVDYNPAMLLQIGGTALALLVVGLVTFAAFTRFTARRFAPLRIQPAIYRVPKALAARPAEDPKLDEPLAPLWERKPHAVHTHTFPLTDFAGHPDLVLLNIQELTFTTDHNLTLSNRKAAKASILLQGGDPLKGQVIEDGAIFKIAEDHQAFYYLTNGVKSPSARQLLNARS